MDRIEEMMKKEFDNAVFPEKDMLRLVREGIDRQEQNKSGYLGTIKRMAAVLAVIILSLSSVGVYAKYNDESVQSIIMKLWGMISNETIITLIDCEASFDDVVSTMKSISIEPVKVIGDSDGVYIVMKYECSEDINPEDYFEAIETIWQGKESVSSEIINIPSEGDNKMFAIECMSETMSEYMEPIANNETERDKVFIHLSNDEGYCNVSFDYRYTGESRYINEDICSWVINPLTVKCIVYSEDDYYDIMDAGIELIDSEGERIRCSLNYGIDNGNDYIISFKTNIPISPEMVQKVVCTMK